jgi:hypothetical protein
MYGLPLAGILESRLLARCLPVHGYHQKKFTSGLWEHISHPIKFSLVVEDFVVQYVVGEHANRLINALDHSYTYSKDWPGSLYCDVVLYWDYTQKNHFTLSMPGYITDALQKYQNTMQQRPDMPLTLG